MILIKCYLLLACLTLSTLANDANNHDPLEEVFSKPIYDINEKHENLHTRIILEQQDRSIKSIKSLNTRHVTQLNGLYDFCFDPNGDGFKEQWYNSPLASVCGQSGNYYQMPVPAAFNEILSNKTAKDYMGWMWYQREFLIHKSDTNREQMNWNWLLQFENVNYMSIMWLQIFDDIDDESSVGQSGAKMIGSHVGGHLPIVLNISSLISAIQSKTEQSLRLTIGVSNMLASYTIPSGKMINLTNVVGFNYNKFEPDFDFFHYSGIMGNVQLVKLASIFIEDMSLVNLNDERIYLLKVCLSEPRAMNVLHRLERKTRIIFSALINEQDQTASKKCHTIDLCSYDKTMPYKCNEILTQFGHAEHGLKQIRFNLLANDGYVRDVFEIKALKRANISEMMVKTGGGQLQGFGTHHEQLFSGREMSLAAIVKDVQLMKRMGANIVRTSHYPYSSAYLDVCDQLGLMVIAESPAVGMRSFEPNKLLLHKQILREMMQRDHGHAAIVMWSLANEPQSQLQEARKYFEILTKFARTELAEFTIEAHRPLTAAIAQSYKDDTIGHTFDIIMINNYFGWYDYTAVLESVHKQLVANLLGWWHKYGKPLLVSEFGADTIAGLHSTTHELFSEEYQVELIKRYERTFDELAKNSTINSRNNSSINFLGSMIWNFADFSTHESLMRVGANRKGVLTRERQPKLAALVVEQIYTSRAGNKTLVE